MVMEGISRDDGKNSRARSARQCNASPGKKEDREKEERVAVVKEPRSYCMTRCADGGD